MIRIMIFAVLLFTSAAVMDATGQDARIGWVNVEKIYNEMPDKKRIENNMDSYNKQLEKQYAGKLELYRQKARAYQRGASTMSDADRVDREKELKELQTNLNQFETNAKRNLESRRQELLKPVLAKIHLAIKEVAKRNKYTHVINRNRNSELVQTLIYARESDNLNDKVLKELGVK